MRTFGRSWRTSAGVGAVCALAAIGLAGCGELPPGPPQIGDMVPSFEAALVDGSGTVSFEELKGSPFVLNLWATWCPPCRAETPYLQSLFAKYRDRGLNMVGVTVDTNRNLDLAAGFLDEMNVEYIQLHDPESLTLDLFFVLGLPATYIVDAEGIIRLIRPGPVSETDTAFTDMIESLLLTQQ